MQGAQLVLVFGFGMFGGRLMSISDMCMLYLSGMRTCKSACSHLHSHRANR